MNWIDTTGDAVRSVGVQVPIHTRSAPEQHARRGVRFSRRSLSQFLPFLASMALLAWLTWKVSLVALLRALAQLNWPSLIPLTALLVLGTWCGDALGLKLLFATPQRPLAFRTALWARARSYFSMSFNFGLGQGHLAWIMARLQRRTLPWALGRCLLLVYVDLYVLLGLGCLGAVLTDHPHGRWIAFGCVSGLIVLVLTAGLVSYLPGARPLPGSPSNLGRWWMLPRGNFRLMLKLAAVRVGYFSIGMTYAVVGLALCKIGADLWLVVGSVPLMALADGLPISVSGLGTRETTLMVLLKPDDPARLLAFCVSWSGLTLLARALIGLAFCWRGGKAEESP